MKIEKFREILSQGRDKLNMIESIDEILFRAKSSDKDIFNRVRALFSDLCWDLKDLSFLFPVDNKDRIKQLTKKYLTSMIKELNLRKAEIEQELIDLIEKEQNKE